jgi:hypothetical protein
LEIFRPKSLNSFTENRKPKTKTVIQVLGLPPPGAQVPASPVLRGEAGRRWLARELARLDPDAPWWSCPTPPGPGLPPLAAVDCGRAPGRPTAGPFRQVLCFHGRSPPRRLPENFDQPRMKLPSPGGEVERGDLPPRPSPSRGGNKMRPWGQTSGPRRQEQAVRCQGPAAAKGILIFH